MLRFSDLTYNQITSKGQTRNRLELHLSSDKSENLVAVKLLENDLVSPIIKIIYIYNNNDDDDADADDDAADDDDDADDVGDDDDDEDDEDDEDDDDDDGGRYNDEGRHPLHLDVHLSQDKKESRQTPIVF